jgi:hypothetical protein
MKYELQRPLSLRLQHPRIPVTVFNCPRIQVFLRPRIQAFPKQHPTQIHLLPLSQASSALPLLPRWMTPTCLHAHPTMKVLRQFHLPVRPHQSQHWRLHLTFLPIPWSQKRRAVHLLPRNLVAGVAGSQTDSDRRHCWPFLLGALHCSVLLSAAFLCFSSLSSTFRHFSSLSGTFRRFSSLSVALHHASSLALLSIIL